MLSAQHVPIGCYSWWCEVSTVNSHNLVNKLTNSESNPWVLVVWKHSLAEKIDEERESKDKNGCQQLEKNIVDMWKKTLKEKALKKKNKNAVFSELYMRKRWYCMEKLCVPIMWLWPKEWFIKVSTLMKKF